MALPNPEALMESWWPIIIAVVIGVLYAIRQYFRGDRCVTTNKFDGKTVIITGGGSGIGRETALEMAKRGARVILAVRDIVAGEDVASELRQLSRNVHVNAYECDLASMASVRKFTETFKKKESRLHILINNAGVMMCSQAETEDKFEMHMATNYIGHFLLTHLLLDHLKASSPARIINLCAPAYNIGTINFDDIHGKKTDYDAGVQFSQSKLAIMASSLEIAKRLEGTGVSVYVVNPGISRTGIHRHMGFRKSSFVQLCVGPIIWFLMKTPADGAQTVIYCATADSLAKDSGKYYKDCSECEIDERVKDAILQEFLYTETLKWTKLDKHE